MSVELEQVVWGIALEVDIFRLAFLHEYAERNIDYQTATEMWIRSRQTMKISSRLVTSLALSPTGRHGGKSHYLYPSIDGRHSREI